MAKQSSSLLVGQMKEAVLIRPTGLVSLIGIRFHPWGAFPFFGAPLREFAGKILSLDQVSSKFCQQLQAQIGEPSSLKVRISKLEKLLTAKLQDSTKLDARIEYAARLALELRGLVSVSSLSRVTGIGTRQLERKFRQEVGISPKSLCRVLRFQEVFRSLDRYPARQWASIAVACGYYDQAHLIRDFEQFAGEAPTALPVVEHSLTSRFSRAYRMSHLYNTFD